LQSCIATTLTRYYRYPGTQIVAAGKPTGSLFMPMGLGSMRTRRYQSDSTCSNVATLQAHLERFGRPPNSQHIILSCASRSRACRSSHSVPYHTVGHLCARSLHATSTKTSQSDLHFTGSSQVPADHKSSDETLPFEWLLEAHHLAYA
jgi:hypothetical protein